MTAASERHLPSVTQELAVADLDLADMDLADLVGGFPRTRTVRFAPDRTRPIPLGDLAARRRSPRTPVSVLRPTPSPLTPVTQLSPTDSPRTPTSLAPGHPLLGEEAIYDARHRDWVFGPQTDLLADHVARYGPRPITSGHGGALLLRIVEESGLAGRGGAQFPVAAKWHTVITAVREDAARHRRAGTTPGDVVLVANGAEGEPASAKDAALLQHRPHLVLDGVVCVAEVIGATRAVVWLHEGAHATRAAVARALAERREAGLDELPITIATGPDRYLTGEANAVVRALDGGPALPWFRPVPVAAGGGIDGMPTLVHNVETLARTALLARTGTHAPMPGVLVSVLGRTPADQPVLTVRELAPERTVADAVLDRYGHWTAPRAVLIGGYGGTWLRWDEAAGLHLGGLDRRRSPGAGVEPRDVTLGAGVLAPLPVDACGVTETAAIATYLADSSARQCGPCLFGTRALADTWTRIARGTARRGDAEHLARISGEVARRGACALPDAAVNLTLSALRVFADDLDDHLAGAGCSHTDVAVLPIPGREVS
ncbi:MAG: NADH-ubiquinone oxidoreductase-F iron-sulfur binding region domain-containing protein [Kineosporiaceae bacterium]